MKILVISPEAGDLSVPSSLAGTINSSIQAYLDLGASVRVYSPCFGCIIEKNPSMQLLRDGEEPLRNEPYSIVQESIQSPFFFVKSALFQREGKYFDVEKIPYPDNHFRFSLLVMAALKDAHDTGFVPDFIHCHEWAAGLAGAYAKGIYSNWYAQTPVLLTLHNAEYDFHFFEHDLASMGLDRAGFHIDGFEYWGKVSLLKVAVLYADRVVFPSEGYKTQILEQDLGGGIRGFLEFHQAKISAIQHGVDYTRWESPSNKAHRKQVMQKSLGLTEDSSFVLYCHLDQNTRRTADTLFTLWTDLLHLPIQIVVGVELGSLESEMLEVAVTQYPDRLAMIDVKNMETHKTVMQGSDLLFLASTDEPAATLVLNAMACGTIALAGIDIGCASLLSSVEVHGPQNGNTVLVENPWPDQMLRTLRNTIELYSQSPSEWTQFVKNAQSVRVPWSLTAQKYLELFSQLQVQAS